MLAACTAALGQGQVGIGLPDGQFGIGGFLLIHGLVGHQRTQPRPLGLGLSHLHFGLGLLGPGAGQHRLIGRGIDAEQRLPDLDLGAAFGEQPLLHDARARARTWATREASSRPGNSVTKSRSPGCTVTTPTWAGGGAAPPGAPAAPSGLSPPPQADNKTAPPSKAAIRVGDKGRAIA